MGYVSRVILGVSKSKLDKLKRLHLEELDIEGNDVRFLNLFEYAKSGVHNKNDEMTIWEAEYIKWHINDDTCDIISQFIDGIGEDGFIVAIGEDNEFHSQVGEHWPHVQFDIGWEAYNELVKP